MAGGYFTDDQNDKMKALLYPYLMDKAQRRAQQTSGPAYAAREAGYRQDEDNADARGLVSVLGDSASMAGTLQGKRSDVGQLPKYMTELTDNDQQRNANLFKERAAEENSLGTDLGIAKFVGDEDYRDKDLKARSADREAERQSRLAAAAAAAKAKADDDRIRDQHWQADFKQRGDLGQGRLKIEGGRLQLDRDKMNRPGGSKSPSYQVDPNMVGPNGESVLRNPKDPNDTRLAPMPAGVKPKKTPRDPNATGDADIAKKYAGDAVKSDGVANMIDAGVKQIEAYKAAGNKSQAVTAAKNMIKDLNSTFGADAIGAEESKRLAAYLENLRYDVLGGNFGIGPDIDAFIEQAKGKAKSVHAGAATNFQKAKEIREHGLQVGGQTYDQTPTAPPASTTQSTAPSDPTQMSDDELKAQYNRLKAAGHIK
jgi:hypothetical protein